MTRCGAPSSAVVTTVSNTDAGDVAVLDVVGHAALLREQEAGAHGDAVGAVRERGDEAASVVEAAGAEHRDRRADRVDHLRQQQRRRDRAGVAAALAALRDHGVDAPLEHLLGVPPGADRRHAQRAGVVEPRDRVLRRRAGERHDAHAFAR